jgi:choline monooxygenase
VPITPRRTRVVCETFVEASMTAEEIEMMDRFSMQVAAEDRELVESVQRGLESGHVEHAHLMVQSESLVDHFDRLVRDAMA